MGDTLKPIPPDELMRMPRLQLHDHGYSRTGTGVVQTDFAKRRSQNKVEAAFRALDKRDAFIFIKSILANLNVANDILTSFFSQSEVDTLLADGKQIMSIKIVEDESGRDPDEGYDYFAVQYMLSNGDMFEVKYDISLEMATDFYEKDPVEFVKNALCKDHTFYTIPLTAPEIDELSALPSFAFISESEPDSGLIEEVGFKVYSLEGAMLTPADAKREIEKIKTNPPRKPDWC